MRPTDDHVRLWAGFRAHRPRVPELLVSIVYCKFWIKMVSAASISDCLETPTWYQMPVELSISSGRVVTHDHMLQRVWGS